MLSSTFKCINNNILGLQNKPLGFLMSSDLKTHALKFVIGDRCHVSQ
jgi:hypothetical protein